PSGPCTSRRRRRARPGSRPASAPTPRARPRRGPAGPPPGAPALRRPSSIRSSLPSQGQLEVVLGRELDAEVVGREAVAEVLPLAPLDLRSEEDARGRVIQEIGQRVLALLERVVRLA